MHFRSCVVWNDIFQNLRKPVTGNIFENFNGLLGMRPGPAADKNIHRIDNVPANLGLFSQEPDICHQMIAASSRAT